MFMDFDLDPDGFLGFAETIFDNFGLDLMAQSRINRTISDVTNLISHVEGVLDALSDIQMGRR
jgi:hypothetical protein